MHRQTEPMKTSVFPEEVAPGATLLKALAQQFNSLNTSLIKALLRSAFFCFVCLPGLQALTPCIGCITGSVSSVVTLAQELVSRSLFPNATTGWLFPRGRCPLFHSEKMQQGLLHRGERSSDFRA